MKLLQFRFTLIILAVFIAPAPAESAATGTLVVDVQEYTSEVKIKKKIAKQLRRGAVMWGMLDNLLVISNVSQQYVKPILSNSTRYGEQEQFELEAGNYKITCIGYFQKMVSSDVDVILSKSAYFNEEIMTFTILPGKITTLEIRPVIKKQGSWPAKLYVAEYTVRVIEDGVEMAEAMISERTADSIAWDDYWGPLKF